ncbi:MAG: UV DNA damage repair endonuclease UvsE, partial [Desulfobacterota bacterium]|nr:UV DNA damage repair endonuclease UvsE [Thermodesulfobacteriota bacterium]
MIRFGLCCIFRNEPIRFKRTTAARLGALPRLRRLRLLTEVCLHNARELYRALEYCAGHGIGCFRINSHILPLKTHPEVGYRIKDLPDHKVLIDTLQQCGHFCKTHKLRTTFHPDQFILLSSPSQEIIRRSVADLLSHAEIAALVGADVINIHGGGIYGDKKTTLKRLLREIKRLPMAVQSRLTLENDDRSYTPRDLLPLCKAAGVPLVYDVHHHRCLPDGMSVEAATKAAIATWNREPVFHISSPLHGWRSADPRLHHDYINPVDFPDCWKGLTVTIEVEAKAKEQA